MMDVRRKETILGLVMVLFFNWAGAQVQEYDDLYFNGSDRKMLKLASESKIQSYSNDAAETYQSFSNGTYSDSYSAKDVNPDYISRYRSQADGQENNLSNGNEEGSDFYLEEKVQPIATTVNNYYGNSSYRYAPNWGNWRLGMRMRFWDPFWGVSFGNMGWGWDPFFYNNGFGMGWNNPWNNPWYDPFFCPPTWGFNSFYGNNAYLVGYYNGYWSGGGQRVVVVDGNQRRRVRGARYVASNNGSSRFNGSRVNTPVTRSSNRLVGGRTSTSSSQPSRATNARVTSSTKNTGRSSRRLQTDYYKQSARSVANTSGTLNSRNARTTGTSSARSTNVGRYTSPSKDNYRTSSGKAGSNNLNRSTTNSGNGNSSTRSSSSRRRYSSDSDQNNNRTNSNRSGFSRSSPRSYGSSSSGRSSSRSPSYSSGKSSSGRSSSYSSGNNSRSSRSSSSSRSSPRSSSSGRTSGSRGK